MPQKMPQKMPTYGCQKQESLFGLLCLQFGVAGSVDHFRQSPLPHSRVHHSRLYFELSPHQLHHRLPLSPPLALRLSPSGLLLDLLQFAEEMRVLLPAAAGLVEVRSGGEVGPGVGGLGLVVCFYFSELSVEGPVHELEGVLPSGLFLPLLEGEVLSFYFFEVCCLLALLVSHPFYFLETAGFSDGGQSLLVALVLALNPVQLHYPHPSLNYIYTNYPNYIYPWLYLSPTFICIYSRNHQYNQSKTTVQRSISIVQLQIVSPWIVQPQIVSPQLERPPHQVYLVQLAPYHRQPPLLLLKHSPLRPSLPAVRLIVIVVAVVLVVVVVSVVVVVGVVLVVVSILPSILASLLASFPLLTTVPVPSKVVLHNRTVLFQLHPLSLTPRAVPLRVGAPQSGQTMELSESAPGLLDKIFLPLGIFRDCPAVGRRHCCIFFEGKLGIIALFLFRRGFMHVSQFLFQLSVDQFLLKDNPLVLHTAILVEPSKKHTSFALFPTLDLSLAGRRLELVVLEVGLLAGAGRRELAGLRMGVLFVVQEVAVRFCLGFHIQLICSIITVSADSDLALSKITIPGLGQANRQKYHKKYKSRQNIGTYATQYKQNIIGISSRIQQGSIGMSSILQAQNITKKLTKLYNQGGDSQSLPFETERRRSVYLHRRLQFVLTLLGLRLPGRYRLAFAGLIVPRTHALVLRTLPALLLSLLSAQKLQSGFGLPALVLHADHLGLDLVELQRQVVVLDRGVGTVQFGRLEVLAGRLLLSAGRQPKKPSFLAGDRHVLLEGRPAFAFVLPDQLLALALNEGEVAEGVLAVPLLPLFLLAPGPSLLALHLRPDLLAGLLLLPLLYTFATALLFSTLDRPDELQPFGVVLRRPLISLVFLLSDGF